MTGKDKRNDGVTVDGLARMLQDGRITRRGFLAGAAGLLGSIGAAEALFTSRRCPDDQQEQFGGYQSSDTS
jgi:hypothetical protein